MRPPRTQPRRRLVSIILVLGVFIAGNLTGSLVRSAAAADAPAEFSLFWEAWDLVTTHFVDRNKIDVQAMTYGAINGMLAAMGDSNHTAFLTPMEAELQQSSLDGAFEGIGAYVDRIDGRFTVIAPIHDSPAARAGLRAGDVVLAVDGEAITGQEEWAVISKIRGPAGEEVILTIQRPASSAPLDIPIVRGKVTIDSVQWAVIPDTALAYVQISQFAAGTSRELRHALTDIQRGDGVQAIDGIVLDLRNNPGGYLNEALGVASHFLNEGQVIVHERDADGVLVTHRARQRGLARQIPLIVLINEGSASAAEILAGALQAHERAAMVGEPTLGTGTVLRIFTLSDGSVLRLGVTHWLTPEEQLIKDRGVQPDQWVAQDATTPMVDAYLLDTVSKEALSAHPDAQFQAALLQLSWLQPLDTSAKWRDAYDR